MATFTEFCCRSGGSNLNAGTRTGSTTVPGTGFDLEYASGNWVQSTGVFTVASGNPVTDGVVAGDFASVYANGSTVTGFVGRVTNRDATTITVSLTAKAGTAPTDGTGNRTLRIGGAWKGPNAASGFPFNFVQNTLTDASGNYPRVNFRNDANYAITAAMTHANAGPFWFQGFTTAYGDLGKAVIDGTIVGASYVLLTVSGAWCTTADMIFQNNGTTGSATLVVGNTNGTDFLRVVFSNSRGIGLNLSAGRAVECESYACNTSNAGGNVAAFTYNDRGAVFLRCIAHDNTGSNAFGFACNGTGGGSLINCIADSNGGSGFFIVGNNAHVSLVNCDAYNNGGDGIRIGNSASTFGGHIENCNLVKNSGWGINGNAASPTSLQLKVFNCGFGSGSQVNGSGSTNLLSGSIEVGSITYASGVTPWVDPANGDFRLVPGNGAINQGRGSFTQTAASYSGTVSYPVIGAAPPLNTMLPLSIDGVI